MLLCASSLLHSQTAITTYYVIPPTSGCNGVWAIDASDFICGMQYVFTPSMCANFAPAINADTVYFQLCSVPCSVDVWGQQGICGSATTGITTGLSAQQISVLTTYPNPATSQSGYTIVTTKPAQEVKAEIISLSGQMVFKNTQAAPDGKAVLDTSTLAAGTYIVKITVDGALPVLQKLVML